MRKQRESKRKTIRKYLVLGLVLLLFLNIIWYHGLSVTVATYSGNKPSIKPGELYFYVRIQKEYIIRNVTVNNKPAIANIRILVRDLSTNKDILNISLLNLKCNEGYYFKTIEKKIFLENISIDKLYYVYLYDNITKVIIPIGLPVKYNASLYTTIGGGSFYKLDISYGLISKDIVIENINDSWSLCIRITTLDMENKSYTINPSEAEFVNILTTPFYIKIWYTIILQKNILIFELRKNTLVFNTRDNFLLLGLIDILASSTLLIVYLCSKKFFRGIIFRTR